jgi:flavin-dependent dehydrogenase
VSVVTELSRSIESAVCVLGGGPAGSVCAMRLAQSGHETVLVDRRFSAGMPRSESLAASIVPILESLELRGIIDAAVFRVERRNLLLWESEAPQQKALDAAPSLLIERTHFDELLRRAARSAGARVLAPAAGRSPQRDPAGGWIVPVVSAHGPTLIKAKFLVDARGKRRRVRSHDAPRTAAISTAWAPNTRDFDETRIEAGVREWFWGSALPDGSYAATIFLDADRIAGLPTARRMELYRTLLSRSKLLAGLLRGRAREQVQVRDATSGIAQDLIGGDFIRVGEAAVSIDPLSSQGIQAAIVCAAQAAAAVHTILSPNCDPGLAIEFYQERRQFVFRQAAENAARVYGRCNHRTAFWVRRSSRAREALAATQQASLGSMSSSCRLGPSPALRIVDVPVLSDTRIIRAPALVHPALDHPVAYRVGVPVVALVKDVGNASTPRQILQRWTERLPTKEAMNIMSWMWATGILVPSEDATQSDHRPAVLHTGNCHA